MRSSDSYEFSPLRPIRVKKPSGKYRLICIPNVADRVVQKAVQIALFGNRRWRFTNFNGTNYGFVKGKKVSDAVKAAVEYRNHHPFVYKTDIKSFFDNIDRVMLKEKIRQTVPHKSLHPLLCAAVDCEIAHVSDHQYKAIRELGVEWGKGVRQGLPLSPLFSNFYLNSFDELVRKSGIDAVRYADDMIFFSDTEDGCYRLHEFCKDRLEAVGLTIPELGPDSKSMIVKPNEPIEFLGIQLEPIAGGQYKPAISADQKEHIRNSIINFADVTYLSEHRINIISYAQRLRSLVAGYDAAYRDCLDTTVLVGSMIQWARKACRELFVNHFHIDFDEIDDKARQFIDVV
jgi:hypothetical protein